MVVEALGDHGLGRVAARVMGDIGVWSVGVLGVFSVGVLSASSGGGDAGRFALGLRLGLGTSRLTHKSASVASKV